MNPKCQARWKDSAPPSTAVLVGSIEYVNLENASLRTVPHVLKYLINTWRGCILAFGNKALFNCFLKSKDKYDGNGDNYFEQDK